MLLVYFYIKLNEGIAKNQRQLFFVFNKIACVTLI